MTEKHRFSLRVKLVIFITVLALITYGTSAFFIYVLSDFLQSFLGVSEAVYTILVLLLGIFWSGILAYFAAGLIIKPLLKLKDAATEAASGNIAEDADVSKSDDEIRSLGVAFNTMLASLRGIITNIEKNFDQTIQSVGAIRESAMNAEQQATSIYTADILLSIGNKSGNILHSI
ncbi:hypothetical protein GCM10008986_11160 [Salinibacillus aidingensis]|uniref:histidine kinase n=1 Tax=Salinibacillus aidingensis TaxID=237684 RepID=A0ABN1AZX0_9BACI